jgi:hypothetical protein
MSARFTACEQADRGYACRDDVDNLFHQLDGARMSWNVWLEYSYSLLRTIQDGFGVGPYLGSAAQVTPLPVVWK